MVSVHSNPLTSHVAHVLNRGPAGARSAADRLSNA